MQKKQLIVTADDYGMCEEVNKAIEDCIRIGMVKSTNVLTNLGDFSEISRIKSQHKISVGIHWNLTCGRPLSCIEEVPSLVNGDGNFYSVSEFKQRVKKGLVNENEIIKELNAQYEKLFKLVGKPDYWNVHENASLLKKTFKIFSKVALERNIIATRNFQRVYFDKDKINLKRKLREFLVNIYINLWFGRSVSKTFLMPDGRLMTFGKENKSNNEKLINSLIRSRKVIIELVIHPATIANGEYFGNMGQSRVDEYNHFSKKNTYENYIMNEIELVSFDVLMKKH